jgi:integrase
VFKPRLKDKKLGDCWIIPSTRYADQPMRSIRGSLDAMKTATGCHVSPHDLRRTYATIALAALGDMTMVRRLLTHDLSASHARMATTAGYVITSELDYRRMVEKVGKKIVTEATKKRKGRDEAAEADTKPGDRGSGGAGD